MKEVSKIQWMTITSLRVFAYLGIAFLLGTLLYLLQDALIPFIAAWLIAFLLVPIVDFLHRFMPREAAILLLFLPLVALLGGFLFFVLPAIQQQIGNFINELPAYMASIHRALDHINTHLKIDWRTLVGIVEGGLRELGTNMLAAPGSIVSTASELINVIVNILLIPIVAFYLLRDWHNLEAGIKSLLQIRDQRTLTLLFEVSNRVLPHYLHGLLLVMLVVGTLYTIGFMWSGISLGLVLGLLAGLVYFIPFGALVISGGTALILAVVQFHDMFHPTLVLITIAVTEFIGNIILMPVLVGRFVRVHPAVILVSVIVGGTLYGILGMALALPLAAVVTAFWRASVESRQPPPA